MTIHIVGGQSLNAPRAAARVVAPADAHGGAGLYGWLTPVIAAIAAHDAGFAARAFYLTRGELHFIGLTAALMAEAHFDGDHLAAFARAYGVLERRAFVAAMAPETDAAIVKLAPKLAGAPWRPASYRRLAALFAEPRARKALRHLPRITRRHVFTLARLAPQFRTPGVLKMVRRKRDLGEVVFAIELTRRIRTDLSDTQILASLEKADSKRIRDWVMKHYARVPFPPAPTPPLCARGVEVLRPLSTYDDVARAAREFENCIRTYLMAILKGDSYFYRYAPEAGGKGVAIVELRKMPVIGWIVHEALGPDDDRISGRDRAGLLAVFSEAGISAAPQAVDPNHWFDLNL